MTMPLPRPDAGGSPSSRPTGTSGTTSLSLPVVVVLAYLCLLAILAPQHAHAQIAPVDSVRIDTSDTATAEPPASLSEQAGAQAPDEGDDHPVEFAASDSLIFTFDEQVGDAGDLFGNVDVTYGEAQLQAYHIRLLLERDELHAEGLPTDTGLVGRPYFERGEESFYGDAFTYNMQTERGRVVGARTSFDEGFVRGDVVKLMEDSTVFVADGTYSTCECETDPSYSLRSTKMKVQEEWVYTGPIQLYIFNIPMPLWLPFGFLPATEGRRSGPLPPQYGEDERGFYLKDWGWYWAVNDFVDLELRGGLWSRGTWQASTRLRYNRRYSYNGQFYLNYTRNRRGEPTDPDFTVQPSAALTWRHSQTINPYSNFGADVNLTSSGYLRYDSERYEDRYTQTISSSVKYSNRWQETSRSITVSLNQRQNLSSGDVSLTAPSFRFTQPSRKPFARERRPPGEDERWYEKLTYNYSASLNNRYQFNPANDSLADEATWYEALFDPRLYRAVTGDDVMFDFEAQHNVDVSAPFTVHRLPVLGTPFPVSFSPRVNYTEQWFAYTERQRLVDGQREVTEVPDFFPLRQFSTGLSASSTIYGLFPVRLGPYNGLRHTVRPSLSLSYRPDFYGDFWNYTRTYIGSDGREVPYAIRPEVGRGTSQSLSLNVSNVFETRRLTIDSTGAQQSNPLKLLNVDASTLYNFAADSFKLGDLQLSARTRLFGDVSVNFRSTFSPYQVSADAEQPRRTSRYVWSDGFGLPRLTRASLSINTRFNGGQDGQRQPVGTPRVQPSAMPNLPAGDTPLDPSDPFASPYYNTQVGYADFSIPWSLDLRFNYSYSRPVRRSTRTITLNTSFDFNLTPRWKVQTSTGYDFERHEVVPTTINLHRDLDCWEMSFRWTPFGRYQSFGFDLHVKSGQLRDLLRIRQPRSEASGRFSGLLN